MYGIPQVSSYSFFLSLLNSKWSQTCSGVYRLGYESWVSIWCQQDMKVSHKRVLGSIHKLDLINHLSVNHLWATCLRGESSASSLRWSNSDSNWLVFDHTASWHESTEYHQSTKQKNAQRDSGALMNHGSGFISSGLLIHFLSWRRFGFAFPDPDKLLWWGKISTNQFSFSFSLNRNFWIRGKINIFIGLTALRPHGTVKQLSCLSIKQTER